MSWLWIFPCMWIVLGGAGVVARWHTREIAANLEMARSLTKDAEGVKRDAERNGKTAIDLALLNDRLGKFRDGMITDEMCVSVARYIESGNIEEARAALKAALGDGT